MPPLRITREGDFFQKPIRGCPQILPVRNLGHRVSTRIHMHNIRSRAILGLSLIKCQRSPIPNNTNTRGKTIFRLGPITIHNRTQPLRPSRMYNHHHVTRVNPRIRRRGRPPKSSRITDPFMFDPTFGVHRLEPQNLPHRHQTFERFPRIRRREHPPKSQRITELFAVVLTTSGAHRMETGGIRSV